MIKDYPRTPAGLQIAHADHGLEPQHLAFIDTALEGWDGSFKILLVQMSPECPDLSSALYGPSAGDAAISDDEVAYEKRGKRPGPSRLIDKPHRPCRGMVIIVGPMPAGPPLVYTAYGTQSSMVSPREWWDSGMKPHEAIESATFWSQHALAR